MIRIATPTAEKIDRDNPTRMSEVCLYGVGTLPQGLPRTITLDEVTIEFRPYRRGTTIVVHVNVYNVVFNPQYRATLRSLLGNKFGRFVHRRIRSHRRWNINSERPNVSTRVFDDTVDRIILRVVEAQTSQIRTAPQQIEQLATT